MKNLVTILSVFLFLIVVTLAHAEDSSARIGFRGSVVDGPFANSTIDGYCHRRARGDRFDQTTRCVVKIDGDFKIVDPRASVQVVGGNRALRIILGPGMRAGDLKGNFKLSSFQATTYFDREISLFDIPDSFLAVEASIGGVSIAGGTSTTNPDCLIWDIVGDGVF